MSNYYSTTELFNMLQSRCTTCMGLLVFTIGLTLFCLLSQNEFNDETYISENALIVGNVVEKFENTDYLRQCYRKLSELYDQGDSAVREWLSKELGAVGLEVYEQNFTFRHGLLHPIDELTGSNLYGIMRSSSGRTEAILITVPMPDFCVESESCYIGSISIVLATLRLFRVQNYWAKDIVVLFPKFDYVGLMAWFDAYYGVSSSSNIVSSQLEGRSGSIQAGLNLEFTILNPRSFDIVFEGINGLLPNLDLVNTVVRLANKHSIIPVISGQYQSDTASEDVRANDLQGLLHGVWAQASGTLTGLHGLHLLHQVPAVTLRGLSLYQDASPHHSRISMVPRVLEGVLRSLNNLQERMNRSFFYYLLPNPSRYISIGIYTPPVIIMATSLLVKLIKFWPTRENVQHSESKSTASTKHRDGDAPMGNNISKVDSDQVVRQRRGLKKNMGSQKTATGSSYSKLTRSTLANSHISPTYCLFTVWSVIAVSCGLVLYSVPQLLYGLSQNKSGHLWISWWLHQYHGWTIGDLLTMVVLSCFFLLAIMAPLLGCCFQWLIVGSYDADYTPMKFISLALWALFFGCLSTLNISSTVLLTVYTVPLLLLSNGDDLERSRFTSLFHSILWILIASPTSIVLIGCIVNHWGPLVSDYSLNVEAFSTLHIWDMLKRCVTQSSLEADLFGSWSWPIFTIGFTSLWTMTWINLWCL